VPPGATPQRISVMRGRSCRTRVLAPDKEFVSPHCPMGRTKATVGEMGTAEMRAHSRARTAARGRNPRWGRPAGAGPCDPAATLEYGLRPPRRSPPCPASPPVRRIRAHAVGHGSFPKQLRATRGGQKDGRRGLGEPTERRGQRRVGSCVRERFMGCRRPSPSGPGRRGAGRTTPGPRGRTARAP
jgi:hypothetical protein